MAEEDLSDILAEADRSTDRLRWGTERLRRATTEQAEMERQVRKCSEEDPQANGLLNQRKERVEQERAELKDRLAAARKQYDQTAEQLKEYKCKPTGSNWPLRHGREHWDRARNRISEDTRLLERSCAQLDHSIDDAVRALGERPEPKRDLWGPVMSLHEILGGVIEPVLDFMLRGIARLTPDISGLSIGIPHFTGLPGLLGLKFSFKEKGEIGNRRTYETTLPRPTKIPFFPT
jgi:hypothetical protein